MKQKDYRIVKYINHIYNRYAIHEVDYNDKKEMIIMSQIITIDGKSRNELIKKIGLVSEAFSKKEIKIRDNKIIQS